MNGLFGQLFYSTIDRDDQRGGWTSECTSKANRIVRPFELFFRPDFLGHGLNFEHKPKSRRFSNDDSAIGEQLFWICLGEVEPSFHNNADVIGQFEPKEFEQCPFVAFYEVDDRFVVFPHH